MTESNALRQMNLQQQPVDDRRTHGVDVATVRMRDRVVMPLGRGLMSEEKYTQRLSIPSRPRAPTERVELPSIRQAVPEIELRDARVESPERATDLASYSPRTTRIWETPSEESSVDAHGKRRRLSRPEERSSEPRDYSARPFPSPTQLRAPSVNPSPAERQTAGFFTGESWSTSGREPGAYGTPVLPAMRLTPRLESGAGEARPTLPSLPSLTLERTPSMPTVRSPLSDYVLDASRSSPPVPAYGGSNFRPSPANTFGNRYGYVKARGQSLADLTMHPPHASDRPMYAPRGYFPERHEMHELGAAVEGTKNRKRRGNLPKETTDKLRAWFVAHLHHPYPTEDEKQDLMRQTKLQMNQISNWFINARRRQLPAMINNARVESDARSARSAPSVLSEGSHLGGSEREMSDEEKRNMELGLGLSYGTMESGSEGDGGYEDGFDHLDRTRSADAIIY